VFQSIDELGRFTETEDDSAGRPLKVLARRVLRDESAASGVVTQLVFSGSTSVQEYTLSGNTATLVVETIRGSDWGGGVGGVLYTLRGGIPSYTHFNSRGDVTAKTNAVGSLTYQAAYEAYGTRTQEQGSTLDRQKANTKDEDPTGLLNEGFRYRDLETGTFITRDPLGFVDGPNLYAYVVQNPWTYFDPEGLKTEREEVEKGNIPPAKQGGNVVGTSMYNASTAQTERNAKDFSKRIADNLPVISTIKAIGDVASGDMSALPDLLPNGKTVKGIVKGVIKKGEDVSRTSAKQVKKSAEEAADASSDAAKKTASEIRAENIAKGIPESQLGPSGKPKVHIVEKSTRKETIDAAREAGGSKPIKNTQDSGQPTHYHPVDADGNKLTGNKNIHFQQRGAKENPE
jgi:RHS repeat-associated protein